MGAGAGSGAAGPSPGLRRRFPAGSTPLGCYRKLVEYCRNGDLSFQYVKTFNMDEYVGECPPAGSDWPGAAATTPAQPAGGAGAPPALGAAARRCRAGGEGAENPSCKSFKVRRIKICMSQGS